MFLPWILKLLDFIFSFTYVFFFFHDDVVVLREDVRIKITARVLGGGNTYNAWIDTFLAIFRSERKEADVFLLQKCLGVMRCDAVTDALMRQLGRSRKGKWAS